MKVKFDDKSCIEVTKNADKIILVLYAKDSENTRKTIISSCEMTKEQFDALYKSVM